MAPRDQARPRVSGEGVREPESRPVKPLAPDENIGQIGSRERDSPPACSAGDDGSANKRRIATANRWEPRELEILVPLRMRTMAVTPAPARFSFTTRTVSPASRPGSMLLLPGRERRTQPLASPRAVATRPRRRFGLGRLAVAWAEPGRPRQVPTASCWAEGVAAGATMESSSPISMSRCSGRRRRESAWTV